MPEEERLTLVSEVEDEFTEPLERFESALESVDDEIRETGRGQDYIGVDVEVSAADAVGEIESIDKALADLDDEHTVDIDTDASGVGGQTAVTSGGRPSIDDAVISDSSFLNRQSSSLRFFQDVNRRLDEIGDGLDIANFDNVALTTARNPRTEFRGPFMQGERTASPERMAESFAWLNGEDNPFEDIDATDRLLNNPDGEVGTSVDEMRDTWDVDVDMDSDVFEAASDDFGLGGGRPLGKDLVPQMRRLGKTVSEWRFTMGSFHQMIASLIPILGVFVGALPAAIVGVGALATAALGAAAALGGVAALGAVGMMATGSGLNTDSMMQRLRGVAQSYLDAFRPLAESLAPVMSDAIGAVERMAGPLANASSGLRNFTDEFRGVTAFMTTAIPSFTAEMLAFAHAAEPLISGIVSTVAGVDFLGYFATHLVQVLPLLTMLGASVMQIIPAVVSLSQGFLAIATMITLAVGGIAWLLNLSPMLTTVLGGLIGALITLVTVSTLYTIATEGMIASSLQSAKSAIVTAGAYYKQAAAALVGATSTMAFTTAVALLAATLGVGIVALGVLSGKFQILSGNIADARKQLKKFSAEKNALNSDAPITTGGGTPMSNSGNVYRDNSTTVINAGNQDDAARQQYSSAYERRQHAQHVDSVFGSK